MNVIKEAYLFLELDGKQWNKRTNCMILSPFIYALTYISTGTPNL